MAEMVDARLTGAPYCESLDTEYSSGGLDGKEELQAWVMGFLDGTTQLTGCDSDMQGIKPNSQLVRKKNRENTHQRKTITRTRQYLRGSAICLCPQSCRDITIIREEYKVQLAAIIFSLYIKHDNHTTLKNPNYKRRFNNGQNGPKKILHEYCTLKKKHTQYYSGRVVTPYQTKLGSTKPDMGMSLGFG